jgi:hypothetical protein
MHAYIIVRSSFEHIFVSFSSVFFSFLYQKLNMILLLHVNQNKAQPQRNNKYNK